MRYRRFVRHVFPLAAGMILMVPLEAADPQAEKVSAAPPEEVSQALRSELPGEGIRVSQDGAVLAEFWLRPSVPAEGGGSAQLGVTFSQFQEGTFFGVVRFPEQWSDYKEGSVAAGTYTLRYGVQPADGNHLGVSLYRDYFLLIPAADDQKLAAEFGRDDLVKLSNKASGAANHPAVLSIFPVYEEVDLPAVLKNEMDQWMLALSFGDVKMGLVLIGHGEH